MVRIGPRYISLHRLTLGSSTNLSTKLANFQASILQCNGDQQMLI
jgi:hypothetical protein